MPVSPSHTARIARCAPGRTAGDEQRARIGAILRSVGPYPGNCVTRVGYLVGECHVRLQRALTAPGATLFPQYIGDVFIAFTSVCCTFLAEIHAGDTLYPQLQITDLAPHGDACQVTTRATIRNQHGQLVLDGEHTYLLKTAQQSTSQGAS